MPYNLRQRKEEVEEGMVGSGRGGINDVETKTGNERSGVNYGVQSRRVNVPLWTHTSKVGAIGR